MENLLTDSEHYFEELFYLNVISSFLRSNKTNKKLLIKSLNKKSTCHLKHSRRVSVLATALAKHCGLEKPLIKKIKIAALLHDVGKLAISEQLLSSPRRLTDEEFEIVKQHSNIGSRLLHTSNNLQEISNYVLEHHERYDGTGYPNKISGQNISLPARIIAIADSYDAMTSERSYKKTLTKNEAIAELERCSSTQFDPELVKIFIKKVLKKTMIK